MLQKPDIVQVMQIEGSELKQRGRYLWALCLLHDEKTASCKVDRDRQTFHCFGCNAGGDVITFIMELKNISFKDALRYLGIDNRKPSPQALQNIQREKRKRELVKKFRRWEDKYCDEICYYLRQLDKKKMKAKTIAEEAALSALYYQESTWEQHWDILMNGDDAMKLELYQEVTANGTY